MKIILSALLAVALLCLPAPAQTTATTPAPAPQDWYLRADGGTRYSVNNPTGQCNGLADAPAPAAGLVNQPCAFGDAGSFAFDGGYTGAGSWVIKGGDRVHVHKGQYRVGYRGPWSNNYMLPNSTAPGCTNAASVGCYSVAIAGNPFAPAFPPIPSGTAANPTQIIGDGSATTQIFGGYGAWAVVDLSGSGFVSITGIELTRHSQCTIFGSPAVPGNCSKSYPLDDYAMNGIITNNATHDIVLNDVNIHGFTSRGIIGPIGGIITATNVRVAYNGAAGWDLDDGNATPSVNGVLNLSGVTIEWNGCNQAYPGTGAISCYGQSDGGYGDGLGTPAGTCISSVIDHSTFRYNTQDGYDMLHNDTGNCHQTITNSTSYGNNGSQFKFGPNDSPFLFTGNMIIGNCVRLLAPMTGQPSTFNANLHDGCRASDMLPIGFRNGNTVTIDHNSFVTYAPTSFDYYCYDADCTKSVFNFTNNIVLGYDDPNTYPVGGQAGGPGGFYTADAPAQGLKAFNGTTNRTGNVYFGMRNFAPLATEKVADPLFVGEPTGTGATFTEAELDNFNFALTSGSPAAGLGASVSTSTAPPPPPVPPAPTPIYPLSFTTTVSVPATTIAVPAVKPAVIQPPAITPPSITVPASTKTCTYTQASATATPVLTGCK